MLTQRQECALDTVESRIHSHVRRFVQEGGVYRQRGLVLSRDRRYIEAIVPFLEEQFDIQVASHEMSEDNFGSLRAVARFVAKKRQHGFL